MRVGGQSHAPAALPKGTSRCPFYRRLGELQGRSGRVRKFPPPHRDLIPRLSSQQWVALPIALYRSTRRFDKHVQTCTASYPRMLWKSHNLQIYQLIGQTIEIMFLNFELYRARILNLCGVKCLCSYKLVIVMFSGPQNISSYSS
jgi:hypothetical protein